MKLNIELVPLSSWMNNLRKSIPRKEWDKIRKKAYAEAGNKCEICGWEGSLSCHEIWSYDDTNKIQKLEGFIALCGYCHHIKHIGLAGILAREGKLNYNKLVNHFMRVNKCSEYEFLKHRDEAFKTWEIRSHTNWIVDFGEFEYLKNKLKSNTNTHV